MKRFPWMALALLVVLTVARAETPPATQEGDSEAAEM